VLPYQPAAYRPIRTSPRSGQYGLTLGQTFDQYFSWSPATGDAVRLVFHGATAALGIHVFLTDKGFFRWFGLVLGFGQAVGAICDVLSLAQRALGTHPPEGGQPK
jgi:hypothetical protein